MLKKVNMIKKNYFLPVSLFESLQKKSNETGFSMSDIIRLALKEYLKVNRH
jgi:hypothetical protein